jgi:maltose O-acetyltransferase
MPLPEAGTGAPQLRLGDRASIARFSKLVCAEAVTIGADALIGDRFYVSDVEHEPWVDATRSSPPLSSPRPVVIGDGVHIGVGVTVKPGVSIGDGAYIGAASVVYDDVPAWSVAVGNPARVVRRRGDDGVWRPA